MQQRILDIIKKYPRHYSVQIKKDKELLEWVMNNTMAEDTDHFPTILYSAINSVSNRCDYGNLKKISRINEGYVLCGAGGKCKCYNDLFSKNSKMMHDSFSNEKKEDIKQRRNTSMIKKYGVAYNFLRDDVLKKISAPKVSEEVYKKLSDYDWMNTEYNINKRSAVDIAHELNSYYGTVIEYCKKHGFSIRQRSSYSLIEVQLEQYINELGLECSCGDWSIVQTKEIDIYIPSKKIAIEINGLYWHSYKPSNDEDDKENDFKYKHINKTQICESQNIQLLHFTDLEWYTKPNIVKSIIKSKLGMNEKIYARNCEIKKISSKVSKDFFNNNHLNGFVGGKYHIGLFYNDILVMAIIIGTPRFEKTPDKIELLRCASLMGYTITGGLSKLIKYAKNIINLPIITYCDRNISNGKGYLASGFKYIGNTQLDYFWTEGHYVIPRYKTTKKNLKNIIDNVDMSLTEKQNMFNAGYRIFWGCGNMIFILE